MELALVVHLLSKTAQAPTKAYSGDLGWDFYCSEDVILSPRQTTAVKTDISLVLPPGHGMILMSRSSMALKNLTVEGGE